MKTPKPRGGSLKPERSPEPQPRFDPLIQFAGPVETIAASIPKPLIEAVRTLTGKREFSRYVGRALAREYLDGQRASFVTEMEAVSGPADEELMRSLEELFAR